MKKKPITLAILAESIHQSMRRSVDELAVSVKQGFDAMDQRFDAMDQRFDVMDQRFDGVEHSLGALEQDQDEIKLRLGNVAYRFELNDLNQRVDRLERKAGL